MNTHKAQHPRGAHPPEQMPRLARGAHLHPEDGACLMEYVSVLAGLPFNDSPRCTHPALAALARRVNDSIENPDTRASLVRLAPDLAAAGGHDPKVTLRVVDTCLEAAAVAGVSGSKLRRRLNRVRIQLDALENSGDGGSRMLARLSASRPQLRVQSAFDLFIRGARALPTAERDDLLEALLYIAISRNGCTPAGTARSLDTAR